jgi:ribonuclease I
MKLYAYYCLALQTWCSTDYKIHGLWPDYDATSYPSYCGETPFDLKLLQTSPKYESMLENWYDCTLNDTIALYEHEWLKHGTCVSMQAGFSQNEYFEKALELFEQYKDLKKDTVCFDLEFNMIDCEDEMVLIELNVTTNNHLVAPTRI